MARSIRLLAGPQSQPRTGCPRSGPRLGGMRVMLAIPPRFSSALHPSIRPINAASAIGTSGAPWPPRARSAALKSCTTGRWSMAARRGPCSICQLLPRRGTPSAPGPGGRCQIVWPWQPTSSAECLGSQALAVCACSSVMASASSRRTPASVGSPWATDSSCARSSRG